MKFNGGMEVPGGWSFLPLKRFARFAYGDALPADTREAGSINVYGSNGPFDRHNAANTLGPCIIVGRKGSYGKVQYSEEPVFAVDTTFVLDRRFTSADLRFLYYLLDAMGLDELSDDTAVPGLSREKAYQTLAPLPPPETQRRIASFLDEKTAQIEALIDKKRALLERLSEKRQALIIHAVTKGLNANAEMKPSGVDWLGQIPAHWEVLPLRRVLQSSTYGISASLDPTGEIAVLRMGNLVDGEIDFGDLRYLSEVDASLLLEVDDIVFNRTNSLDLVGKASLFRGRADTPVSFASYLVRFRFTGRYLPGYANFVMGTEGLLRLARTLALPSIGQANLNPSRYAQIEFPIPPVQEQSQIVSYLAEQVGAIGAVWSRVERSLQQLTEYRSALVTAAVTGEIADLV